MPEFKHTETTSVILSKMMPEFKHTEITSIILSELSYGRLANRDWKQVYQSSKESCELNGTLTFKQSLSLGFVLQLNLHQLLVHEYITVLVFPNQTSWQNTLVQKYCNGSPENYLSNDVWHSAYVGFVTWDFFLRRHFKLFFSYIIVHIDFTFTTMLDYTSTQWDGVKNIFFIYVTYVSASDFKIVTLHESPCNMNLLFTKFDYCLFLFVLPTNCSTWCCCFVCWRCNLQLPPTACTFCVCVGICRTPLSWQPPHLLFGGGGVNYKFIFKLKYLEVKRTVAIGIQMMILIS